MLDQVYFVGLTAANLFLTALLYLAIAAAIVWARLPAPRGPPLAMFFTWLGLVALLAAVLAPAFYLGLQSAVWGFVARDMGFVTLGLALAVYAVYPAPVRLRSWHGAVLVVGAVLLVLGAAAWLFARPWFTAPGWMSPERGTLLSRLVTGEGVGLVHVALLLSAFVRAQALPEAERRGSMAVVLGIAPIYLVSLGGYLALRTGEFLGLGAFTSFTWQFWLTVPGDCCAITLALAHALHGAAAVVAIVAWRRWGQLLPLLLVAAGSMNQGVSLLATSFPPNPVQLVQPLVVLYGMGRWGALGASHLPRASWGILGGLVVLAVFARAAQAGLAMSADPFLSMLTVLAALSLAVAAVALVLPRGLVASHLMALAPAGTAPRRLLVYRAALEGARREAGDPSASPTLRALRAELGISDREHALLAAELEAGGARAALRQGQRFLGRYLVQERLGQGASGEVWRARDERLGRDVAIKRLSGELRRNAEALGRFEREMRLAGALQHPHIAAVHDVETVGDEAFLVMEFVPGGSLADRLRQGALPEEEAVRIARDVLAALEAVHAKGIVHLDVKPANILLDAQGRAKLSDFTVAREVLSGETLGVSRGGPAGTPAYMAPEQARGLRGTARSDLYAVGATLYAALAGRPPIPIEGLPDHEALRKVLDERPALPLRHVSAATNEVLLRALAKDPERRFASAAEMEEALDSTSKPHRRERRRR